MRYAGIVGESRTWWIASLATSAILAVAVWFIFGDDRDREAAGPIGAGPPSTAAAAAVEEYAQFAAAVDDPRSGTEAVYLAQGLRKLAGALATLNVGGPELAIDLRVNAEHILLNPESVETTVMIRDDLVTAADALELDTKSGRSLRRDAESIRADRSLIEQHETVLEFFRRAADVLQRRTASTPNTPGIDS
jgi:hypothetical protein